MNIYVWKNHQQHGPYDDAEVKRRLSDGTLLHTDLAWREGSRVDWQPLQTFYEQPKSSLDPMEEAQPAGIGGWLLLFCIVVPLNMLSAFYHYAVAVLVAVRARAFFPVVLAYCGLGIPISLLGFYTVFLLLTRQGSAIFLVKLFLALYAAHSLLVSVLAFSLAPPEMPPAIEVWYRSLEFRFLILGFCVVWFWYFVASKRVKNTYGLAAKI